MTAANMTDQLRGLCSAIWGPDWVSPLARVLPVGLRTAQRWASGATPVPDWIWTNENLIAAAQERAGARPLEPGQTRQGGALRQRLQVLEGYLATAEIVLPIPELPDAENPPEPEEKPLYPDEPDPARD